MVQQQQAGTRVPRLLEQWVKKLKCSGSSGIGLESFPDIRLDTSSLYQTSNLRNCIYRVGVDPSPVTTCNKFPEPVTSEEMAAVLEQGHSR